MSEPAPLRGRIAVDEIGVAEFHISSALIERFAEAMRERLCCGEIPMRKAYLGSIIDRIEVDDGRVRIMGLKDAIEQGVRNAEGMPPPVRSFVRKWLPGLNKTANHYVIEVPL